MVSEQDDGINFGGIIKKNEVFRCSLLEFENSNDRLEDSHLDMAEYNLQVDIKKMSQVHSSRVYNPERLVIQEKGEQFFHEKLASKSRAWLDSV